MPFIVSLTFYLENLKSYSKEKNKTKTGIMIFRFVFIIPLLFSFTSSLAQNSDAILISQETHVTVERNKLVKDFYFKIQINNREGERYNKVSLHHSSLKSISNIKAHIEDADGKIITKLKKGDITERSYISSSTLYQDDYLKEFTLKHNSYPYTIVYSYQTQEKEFLHIHNWSPILHTKIPTQSAKLTVTTPINYELSYKNNAIDEPKIETIKNNKVYEWHTDYTTRIKSEVYSPLLRRLTPSVEIIPHNFYFEMNGSFKDWTSYGNWESDLLVGINELPEIEKQTINELIKDIDDEKEKIKTLYHYLQDETRYINVSIETGGMKPYPASYVSENKYGDCKALTNYFKSVLDYLEIPSYYANIYAGSRNNPIDKDFPSQQFNHVILYVPQNDDDDIWLDCTSKYAFDYLGTFTQNRDAFIIENNNSYFKETPKLTPQEVLDTRQVHVTYDPVEAIIEIQNTFRGPSYETFAQIGKGYRESEQERIIRNAIASDGMKLIEFEIPDYHRDSLAIQLNYKASSNVIYKHYGNDILISNLAFSIPSFEKPEDRKHPIQLDYPIHERDIIHYEIPEGYTLNKNTEDYSIKNKYGEYKLEIQDKGDEVVVIKQLLIHEGSYPISEYSEFYDFILQVNQLEKKTHLSLHK